MNTLVQTDKAELATEPYAGRETADESDRGRQATHDATNCCLFSSSDDQGATFSLPRDLGSGTDTFQTTVPCFAAGTRILTDRGEVLVEDIAIGQLIVTASGETMPVTWIGSRYVDCRRHPRPASVCPVCIRANAFDDNQPSGDLLLSPDHAVFAEGVLIPIRYLLNGSTVRQMRTAAVTYFHIELAHHAVIFANGLSCESYLDIGDRCGFANSGAFVYLHPSFGL